jgi:hypothetical protein
MVDERPLYILDSADFSDKDNGASFWHSESSKRTGRDPSPSHERASSKLQVRAEIHNSEEFQDDNVGVGRKRRPCF